MEILNLTQHVSTADQNAEEPGEAIKALVKALLVFDDIPSLQNMKDRGRELADVAIVKGYKNVIIGGAPFFMPVLETCLRDKGITPYYAFSKRLVKEVQDEEGYTTKMVRFKHIGFIEGTCKGSMEIPSQY